MSRIPFWRTIFVTVEFTPPSVYTSTTTTSVRRGMPAGGRSTTRSLTLCAW